SSALGGCWGPREPTAPARCWYTCVHVSVCVHAHVSTCASTCRCIYICLCPCVCACMIMYVHGKYMCVLVCIYIYACIDVCVCLYVVRASVCLSIGARRYPCPRVHPRT
uniref:Uncharacterized protein n=1 Tax=Accipiter nisus TaxID=211598 RepID=A0A8B9MV41_9AVES